MNTVVKTVVKTALCGVYEYSSKDSSKDSAVWGLFTVLVVIVVICHSFFVSVICYSFFVSLSVV